MPASELNTLLAGTPVVPVLVIEDWSRPRVPLARALVAGGLPVLEITLRTPAALEAIRAIAAEVEGAVVGAGTVLTPAQYRGRPSGRARASWSARARPERCSTAAAASAVPLLPGAATASEVMRCWSRAIAVSSSFPAEPAGGVAYLKALAAPLAGGALLPDRRDRRRQARAAYLALPNVRLRRRLLGRAEGGSGRRRLASGSPRLARAAAALGGSTE